MPTKKNEMKEAVTTKETKETKDSKKQEAKTSKKEEAPKEVKETKETKESKSSKAKKAESKIVVEEVVLDGSDEEDEIELSDDGSEMSDDEQQAESGDDSKKQTKEKKAKESFQELTTKLQQLTTQIKEVDHQLTEMEKSLKTKERERNDLERQRNKIYSLLDKTHEDEVKRAQKEKPKRKGNKDGGFNKEQPVPPKLIKYLGLEDNVMMARPKVMSMLNNKFKEDGLKEGQKTTLNKNVAKVLGKEAGRVIEFTEFQSFLKEFYEEAGIVSDSKTNTVQL